MYAPVMTSTAEAQAALNTLAACVTERDAQAVQLANCTAALANSQAMVIAVQNQLAQANATIEALRKLIPPPVVPPVRTRFLIGASTPDPNLGPLPIERTYSPGVLGAAPLTASVHSFKLWDTVALKAWIAKAPNGSTITYFHEPEDNIETGQLKVADWIARQIQMCQFIQDAGRVGQVRPAIILMGWSLNPMSKRSALLASLSDPTLVAKLKATKGIWGWDVYAGPGAANGLDKTPEQLCKPLADYSASLGLPWAVGETGAVVDKSTDPAGHVAFWQGVFAWLEQHPPLFFCAWNPPTRPEYVLLPQVAAVWRKAMDTYSR